MVTLNWCMWRLKRTDGRTGAGCGSRKRTKVERGQVEARKKEKVAREHLWTLERKEEDKRNMLTTERKRG